MNVALITPYYHGNRGNVVTVRRIERYLTAAGCRTAVFALEDGAAGLAAGVARFAPDCIHAFHALHGGSPARRVARELGVPYLVTLTGTDLYGEHDAVCSSERRTVLAGAAAVTVFHAVVGERLAEQLPGLTTRVVVVPQGVELAKLVELPEAGPFVFLLPAGIRTVKNVLFPLAPLARLHGVDPRIRFHLAGPVLDEEYGRLVLATLAAAPHAAWLGEVPSAQMGDCYAAASVVLNTSRSEGGMANGLLEGMAAGRPVLAADIEGNRTLVTPGENGLLYRDEEEFAEHAYRLLTDRELARRLGCRGREYVACCCSPVEEARRYRDVYASVCRGGGEAG